MRNFFLLFVIVFGFTACNDGDVIVTTFDFDEFELEQCGDVGDYLFYKINNFNLESLSFQLKTQDLVLTVQDTIVYNINGVTNVVNYRTFRSDVPASYFCSSVPPLSPDVKQNYISTQGTATVSTKIDVEISENAGSQDTTFVRTLNIEFTNLRLENGTESITLETVNFGNLVNNL